MVAPIREPDPAVGRRLARARRLAARSLFDENAAAPAAPRGIPAWQAWLWVIWAAVISAAHLALAWRVWD